MTKITFSDEKLGQAVNDWSAEMEVDSLDEDSRNVLTQTFKDGWSACFQLNLGPAIDLCLLLMRLDKLKKQQNSEGLFLSEQVMDALLQKCHAVVGTAEEGLEDAVETVAYEDPDAQRAPTVTELARALLMQMGPMTGEDRVETIALITDIYCTSCGGPHPETGFCSCDNDE